MNNYTDTTRDLGLLMQRGVRESKLWKFWPFVIFKIVLPTQTGYGLQITIYGAFGLNLGVWRRNDDYLPPAKRV